jgi:hypothetical protein
MTAAHMRHAPRTKGASIKLRWPDALPTSRRPADLKEWCQEQGKKKQPLYELQIEFCQWAIDNMPEDAENADKVAAAVAGLKSETKSLLANKKPVLMGKFTKTETRTVWRKPR